MSTTQELLAAKERYDALVKRIEAVAEVLHGRGKRQWDANRGKAVAYLASSLEIKDALGKHS